MAIKMFRLPKTSEATGDSRSTIYQKIDSGLFPQGVKLGLRSVGWPDYEVDAINAARIAGKSEDEIRALVMQLVAARRNMRGSDQ